MELGTKTTERFESSYAELAKYAMENVRIIIIIIIITINTCTSQSHVHYLCHDYTTLEVDILFVKLNLTVVDTEMEGNGKEFHY